ncbi:MAG: GSCFA domain-containing protein [Pseudomonadota bacterium]
MPYSAQPPSAFWKNCRQSDDFLSGDLFRPKRQLVGGDRIATAGSCFAQNIGGYIRRSSLKLVDTEPSPEEMPEDVARRFGYGLFSARYGNVYTARQLRQLLSDCVTGAVHKAAIWKGPGGAVFDGLRPGTEPEGYGSIDELIAHRREHLTRVRAIFAEADVFIFTLGLTEAWQHADTGLVFPTAPGVIAGAFEPARHRFANFTFSDVLEDMETALSLMREFAPDLQVILTVSPVPLTATATPDHVLSATTYSKSVLRAVAGQLAQTYDHVDYFPSYEMITAAPFAHASYAGNLRSVRADAVARVMSVFFGAYDVLDPPEAAPVAPVLLPEDAEGDATDALICEEMLLDAFAKP